MSRSSQVASEEAINPNVVQNLYEQMEQSGKREMELTNKLGKAERQVEIYEKEISEQDAREKGLTKSLFEAQRINHQQADEISQYQTSAAEHLSEIAKLRAEVAKLKGVGRVEASSQTELAGIREGLSQVTIEEDRGASEPSATTHVNEELQQDQTRGRE